MKKLYLIGGTMGVGKTTVCQRLKRRLRNSVFLDGDWCWDADPFQVTEETKRMVMENICFLLNQFLHCSAYENVIFCWVMHQQSIMDEILENIDGTDCEIKTVSLLCDAETLEARLRKDIRQGLRSEDVLGRSLARIALYENLDTVKVDTSGREVDEIVKEIENL